MKRGRLAPAVALSGLLAVALAAACALLDPGESELHSYACEFEEAGKGVSGSGAVETSNGEVHSLTVQTSFPGLPGKWGYSCTLEATKGNGESIWKTDGLKTTVEFLGGTTWPDGDYARLIPIAGGYKVDLRNTKPTEKCGAGAALPREIVIVGEGKQCLATWDPPL